MEYEKQIKRLVLGYLKSVCKEAYKTFLKSHFPSPHKHVATRVAGQTLQDILSIYSRIQEIIQGRLEETNYYKDHEPEFCSPVYLAEQLLYLLDTDETCASEIRYDRVGSRCSLTSTVQSDVETTPEHSLPGNTPNKDAISATPSRKRSPVFKTPYLEKLPISEHENIASVMTEKLMHKTAFHEKLAHNINTALHTPDANVSEASKKGVCAELEETIKNALNRTEADPMFEDLLQDFFDPIANTIGKVITGESDISSNSTNPNQSTCNVEKEHEKLQTGNNTQEKPQTQLEPTNEGTQALNPSVIEIQDVRSTSNELYTIPSSNIVQSSCQQQQFYVMNQPVLIPAPNPVLQFVQPVQALNNPVLTNCNQRICPTKPDVDITEQDIMSMPTIIINDRNEVTYTDSGNLGNPLKLKEVCNIKEYLNVFNSTAKSPVIQKKKNRKQLPPLKSTPTIKVEIFKNESILTNAETEACAVTELPNLSESEANVTVLRKESSTAATAKPLPSTTCTPSPLVTTVRKPTPKSGSHVRNLSFPSPLRKTPVEKPNANPNSPSAISKQQATKDLFGEKEDPGLNPPKNPCEDEEKQAPKKPEGPPGEKGTEKEMPKLKSPKKATSPKKIKVISPVKRATLKKQSSPKKASAKKVSRPPLESWDARLRKNIVPDTPKTPMRKAPPKKRKKQPEQDISDADGKKLEEALKTPSKKKTKPQNSKTTQREITKSGTKKILSPSKLCTTASKRNMEVDGETPNNPKETSSQLISNARKNITILLETPLKEEEPPGWPQSTEKSSLTPLTPMLKANLKGLIVGDTFSIDTPNFPVTPGLSLMENSTSAAYYILNDNETNKVTEEIVRSEERKSSVRKTDDEDVEISPKVYGYMLGQDKSKNIRAGQKNLDLLDGNGINWDGSSDKEEYKSHSSASNSDEETNNTVIQNSNPPHNGGKRMTVLKSKLLDKNTDCLDISVKKTTDDKVPKAAEANPQDLSRIRAIRTDSGSESEIISKAAFSKAQGKGPKKNDDKKECYNLESTSDEECQKKNQKEEHISSSISSSAIDIIKQAVLDAPLNSCLTDAYSIKMEIEEKRKRLIESAKVSEPTKSRRKTKNFRGNSSLSRSKRSVLKKPNHNPQEKRYESNEVDSQDEFFKRSGSNLHRTKKQAHVPKVSDEPCSNKNSSSSNSDDGKQHSHIPSDEANDSFWEIQLQPEEIIMKHDESKTVRKTRSDGPLNLKNKGFRFMVPLADGTEAPVQIVVTPFKMLWEIDTSTTANSSKNISQAISSEWSSDSENAGKIEDRKSSNKRKHRSDSCSSNSSSKKMKTSLLNSNNIDKLLTKLHGPSKKA